jgi:hypothetical protein
VFALRGDSSWWRFCAEVAALPEGQIWRHNEAGDLPGLGDHLDIGALNMLVRANEGKRGFTFTSKPLRTSTERAAIRSANERGFTINLSAFSLAEADKLASLGIGPVTVVLPSDAPETLTTPAGRAVVVCPFQTPKKLTCLECKRCTVVSRKSIVGFRAHGPGKKATSQLVQLRLNKGAAVSSGQPSPAPGNAP